MSDADRAYELAEQEIAEALKDGREKLDFDDAEFRALEVIPPEIAELDRLRILELDNTQVANLEPIAGLSALTVLRLDNTQVANLEPIAGLSALTELWLNNTQVENLEPIAGLSALTALSLNDTQVENLEPIAGLSALTVLRLENAQVENLEPIAGLSTLTTLWLDNTQVANLEPIAGLTALKTLWLGNTQVENLAPLLDLRNLAEDPGIGGLNFRKCAAAKADPRIAKISVISDNKDRARTLFDYLRESPRPDTLEPKVDPVLKLPAKSRAPLETDIRNGKLTRAPGTPLSEEETTQRAERAWQALKDYREDFEKAFNIHNCQPLPAFLTSFDRAMGENYEPDRAISIGVQGLRLATLSGNTEFLAMLPIGADSDLQGLAAAIHTYCGRFPDWSEYLADQDQQQPALDRTRYDADRFEQFAAELDQTPEAERDVTQSYHAEVDQGTGANSDEPGAQGLMASTSDMVRTLSEHAIADAKSGRSVRDFSTEMEKVGQGEWGKLKFWSGGFAIDLLRRSSPQLRHLAKRYPNRLGWVGPVMDYLFGPEDDVNAPD